ncbi:MAG TPA: hypothetical protein VMW53_02930 [archaeon]|nr:hypothetical protein [archaeon]
MTPDGMNYYEEAGYDYDGYLPTYDTDGDIDVRDDATVKKRK